MNSDNWFAEKYLWLWLLHHLFALCELFVTASRQAVVSREVKKTQHAHTFSGLHNHYSELFYTNGNSKFLKCCDLAAITAIA